VSGVGVLPIAAKGLSPDRLGQLALAVSRLLNADTREEVVEVVRSSARRLCGASGIAIILREGELCHYVAEDSETPLWAGQRFPASHCISGWSMIHRQQAVITDVYQDPRLPHEAYRPTGVQSLVMTPVGRPRPVAALGAYWRERHEPTPDEIASLEAIAESMGAALRSISAREDLEQRLEESERRRRDLEAARREIAFQAHLLDVVEQAVIASDLEGRVTYWNTFAERLYGWSKEEALGRSIHDLGAGPKEVGAAEALLQEVKQGRSWTGEVALARKDGAAFPAWLSVWPIRGSGGELVGMVSVSIDNTDRRRAEDHQQLLINELNHRVKNTLAIVQSIAHQSLRGEAVTAQRAAFEARLIALSDAHNLMVDAGWAALPLDQLAETVLRPFGEISAKGRVRLAGPEILLAPRTAIAFTLALHELATNAAKYGALATPGGHVEFRWRIEERDDTFRAEWKEFGGPPVAAPKRRGFGARLIEQGLASELGGDVALEFAAAGLVCRIEAPRACVLAPTGEALFPLPNTCPAPPESP
jgi:PAS domain S-box-containing protein